MGNYLYGDDFHWLAELYVRKQGAKSVTEYAEKIDLTLLQWRNELCALRINVPKTRRYRIRNMKYAMIVEMIATTRICSFYMFALPPDANDDEVDIL